MISNNLYSYLNANNLFTKNQSGFRTGDPTSNRLLYSVNEIHEAFEHPKSLEIRAVFLDISKAFDKVWNDGLIFKLKQNGISRSLIKSFGNYLHKRKQRVVLLVLGPLLFLIYINNLERNIRSNIKFFADDAILFSIVEDPVISANILNHDLDTIYQWVHQWKMEFNPGHTKQATEVLFYCKKVSSNNPMV